MKLFLYLAVLLPLPLCAEPLSYLISDQNAQRQIVFTSEAPMEVVEGVAERFSGNVVLDPASPQLITEAMVRVSVDGMQTGVSARDTHMKSREWLSAEQYPAIQFSFSEASEKARKKNNNTWFLNARGDFSLKGVNQSVMVPLTITRKRRGNQDEITITGRFDVRLSRHGIRGPAGMRMIGVRVSDTVRVTLKLVGLR